MANKKTNKPYQEYFIVASGNQGLRNSGNIQTTGSSVNLTNGQLGVINPLSGAYLSGGETTSAVNRIRVVQGTPKSSDFSRNLGWNGIETQAFMATPDIFYDQIQQVSTKLPVIDLHSSISYTGLSTPVNGNRYALNLTYRSVRKDNTYGSAVDRYTVGFTAPDSFTGLTSATSHILGNIAYNANKVSIANTIMPTYQNKGQRRHHVVFGINISGSATGTAIGALTAGTSVNFSTDGTSSMAVVMTKGMIQTINNWIANSASITASSKIVNINPATAHSQSIDAIVVMGLDHTFANAYDDIAQVKVDISSTTLSWPDGTFTETRLANAREAEGNGRALGIWFKERAQMQRGNLQLTGFADELLLDPEYIDETISYTVTAIDYLTGSANYDDDHHQNVRVWILLPATDDSGSATASGGITVTTSATTTVTNLNTILGAWLIKCLPYKVNGSATTSTIFV